MDDSRRIPRGGMPGRHPAGTAVPDVLHRGGFNYLCDGTPRRRIWAAICGLRSTHCAAIDVGRGATPAGRRPRTAACGEGRRMKLFCGGSPRRLGIEASDGSWNMVRFREHVESCAQCKCGAGKIMGLIGSRLSPRESAASRENGKRGGRPRKSPAPE